MGFTITERTGTAGDRTGTVYTLGDKAETVRAEVWPMAGFNCLRWQMRNEDGTWGDLLFTAPDWETNPVPTRSGHPVLFPFPNRLRAGQLAFRGKTYQLPLNDSTKQNAIHGFSPRVPWRVVGTTTVPGAASITGQFRLSKDAAASLDLWPEDCILELTYRLSATTLRVEVTVENPGTGPMPFGIGYHPYFRIPTLSDATADEMTLYSAATSLWELTESLPSGKKLPLPPEFDFRTAKPIGAISLDHLFGDLRPAQTSGDLREVARLGHPRSAKSLAIRADSTYGELVLFTPTHRKAVAIEPYSCTTDAANLSANGIEAGWRELSSGGRFSAVVEYCWA